MSENWKFCIAILVCFCTIAAAKTLDVSETVSQLSEANIKFSIDLYKQLIQDSDGENVMFSPISISAAMAMTHLGAKGDTASQIDDTFMFSKIEDGKFHSAFGELHGLLFDKETDNVTVKSSNRVFAKNNLGILEDYKNALTVYGAQVDELDFGNSAASAETINNWIKETTGGKITDLISHDSVDPNTAMMIANAVYFKGDWHSRFNAKQTERRAFYVSHYKVVETSFMFQKNKFRFGYVDSLTLQILEIPYAGKEFSMIILLPDNFDLATVEKELNYDNLTQWLSTLRYQTVDLSLPKFKLEETLNLHNILPKMGVVDIFNGSKSDLSGISKENLHVDKVLHKATLEVLEEGGKVDAERSEAERSDKRVVVYADHPFMVLIRSRTSNAFHLVGAYKRPEGRVRSHDEL